MFNTPAIVLVLVIAVAAGAAWQIKIRHSGSLGNYSDLLADDSDQPGGGTVTVTFLGTTMMLVDNGTGQILIDAFLTPVGLVNSALNRSVSTDTNVVAAALDKAGANRVRAIFISHSHHDHAFDVAYIANRTGATVYGSPSTLNIARGGKVPEERLELLDIQAPVHIEGFTVHTFASKHSPHPMGGEGATIEEPLQQPAGIRDYKEGGTYDFLVTTPNTSILFKGSANWVPGALDGLKVDALFLGIAGLGNATETFRDGYFKATIDTVNPEVVIPTHWNDFFSPVQEGLQLQRKLVDNTPAAFDAVVARARKANAKVKLLDAFSTVYIR